MKKKLMIFALTVLAAAGAGAQTIYDAANIADKDLSGTARFVGMGGALGALGGDLSTINTNPAGIGIYRSNDAAVSFGLSAFGTSSDYQGNKSDANKLRGDFSNGGFVWATKIGNATALRYVNFAFNYQRTKSFYKNMEMGGNLGNFTQTAYMADQAYGITGWGSDPYYDNDLGWLSVMGRQGALITDLISKPELDELLDANPGYTNYRPYMLDGVQATNLDGDLMYYTPGEYVGMYHNGLASFQSEERGGIDQFDFNVSFNFNDRVYLGVTIGAYALNYDKYACYGEDYGGDEYYYLKSWSKISGAGFDLKLGTIIRPFEYSPLRIGLSVHTPVFYSLDYKTRAYLQTDVFNDLSVPNEDGIESGMIGQYDIETDQIARKFKLRTPWTYNVSLGYTIGKELALGAEFEYKDYSTMDFRDDAGFSDSFAWENSTTEMLKGVSTFRIGAEYKVIPEFALRAGYNFRSSLFKEEAYKDLPINSIQTDTDFANTESQSNYTLGIGYRGSMFYADLAYKYTTYDAKFYPFAYSNGERMAATNVSNTRSQVLLTLGLRF